MQEAISIQTTSGTLANNGRETHRLRANVARRVRTRYRVVAHGLRHFCQKLPGLIGDEEWDVRDRSVHTPGQIVRLAGDLASCELVFSWGGRIDMGRFLWAARLLRVQRVVFFWCGSDVLRAQQIYLRDVIDPWIARQTHWAASPMLAGEVRAMGMDCEYVQASFVDVVQDPKPLPRDFSVLVFLPRADVAELYGWDRITAVADALPDLKFKLVGLHSGQKIRAPRNVSVHRWTTDLCVLYDDSTVLWRPVRHDAGISFMVLEAMARGRYVLYTYPLPGATQVFGVADAKTELENLRVLHETGRLPLNWAGIQAVKQTYTRECVRRELQQRWKDIICK